MQKTYQIAKVKFPLKRPTRLYVLEIFTDTDEYKELLAYLERVPPEYVRETYEYWRWPFMSHKAYQLFYDNKIKGIRYYPPAIVE